MILSDRDIKAALDNGRLQIEPLQCPEQQIQPASVDLRLGERLTVYRRPWWSLREQRFDVTLRPGQTFWLRPGDCVLAHTLETVTLPDDLAAQLDGRSTYGRLFVRMHQTPGYIDPGFSGQIVLEISTDRRVPVALQAGQRVCQLKLFRLSSPAETPYGHPRGSHYQGQMGPVPAYTMGRRR